MAVPIKTDPSAINSTFAMVAAAWETSTLIIKFEGAENKEPLAGLVILTVGIPLSGSANILAVVPGVNGAL